MRSRGTANRNAIFGPKRSSCGIHALIGNLSNVVIRNATRAIENHAAITLTNCTITDCEVALDAYAGVTANGCVVADNTDAYAAVDIQAGNQTFINCTIVENAGSALAARGSSAPTLEECVVAFNGGREPSYRRRTIFLVALLPATSMRQK